MRQLLFTILLLIPLLSDAQIHTKISSAGGKYVGEMKDGIRYGQGTYTWPNGDKYVGGYKDGEKHGNGTMTYADRTKDAGEWEKGVFLGPKEINAETNETPKLSSHSTTSNSTIRVRISDSVPDISKVAVIGKESELCNGSIDDGQGLAEVVEGELLGLYGVVERKHLEDILDEQRLAMGGLVFEDSDFAKAGCLAGAQGTVLASYGCLQGKTKIQVKLVDCSTSDMYWSATGFEVSEFELLDELRVKLENR